MTVAANARPTLQAIGRGTYAWIGVGGDSNAGVVEGPDGLIVIDAQQSERLGRSFRQSVETELDKPVHTLIDTHFHLDHTAGNVAFADVPILAHARTHAILRDYLGAPDKGSWIVSDPDMKLKLFFGANVRELVEPGDAAEPWFLARVAGADYQTVVLQAPNVSLPDLSIMELGDDRLVSHYWGPAHCDGDLVIVLEKQKIAFVGDLLFVGRFPWFGDCDIDGWITRLEQVLALDVETIVPGHGPVVTLREVAAFRDLLSAMRTAVAERMRAGMSEEAIVRTLCLDAYAHLPRYAEWMAFNTRATYRYCKANGL